MGWADFSSISSHPNVEIVAICDIDTARAKKVQELVPHAKFYQDWRELLEKEAIDSVNVSTPDHMHAAITMTALEKGCHVYCQKPLTHDIYEARMIGAKAAETGLVTQMGTQLTSMTAERIAVEWIKSETIGKIREVYLWSNKPALQYRPMGPRPENADPVPAHVDWDAWLGTAPERPYVKGVYHPTWWRGWQDFGCGWLGDMGCHIMDMPFRSLGLSMPISVKADVEPEWIANPKRRVETFPQWQIVEYLYPGTDLTTDDTVKLTWSDGGKYPPDELRKHIDGGEWPTQGSSDDWRTRRDAEGSSRRTAPFPSRKICSNEATQICPSRSLRPVYRCHPRQRWRQNPFTVPLRGTVHRDGLNGHHCPPFSRTKTELGRGPYALH